MEGYNFSVMRMEGLYLTWEEGWSCVQEGITKLMTLEGVEEAEFIGSEEYRKAASSIYNMSYDEYTDYSVRLYGKFREICEEHIHSKVLPAVQDKHDELLLRELLSKWKIYILMVNRLADLFLYLDQRIQKQWGHGLTQLAVTRFHDMVLPEINDEVRNILFTLISKEREGEQIERVLLRRVISIYAENGIVPSDRYVHDLETQFIEDTCAYYSRKASSWINAQDTFPQYMLKVEEGLLKEQGRANYYLKGFTAMEIMRKVEHELLVVHAIQLLEREDTGFVALLRDEKVGELSRIYRLYGYNVEVMKLLTKLLRKYIGDQGAVIVQQAQEAVSNEALMGFGVVWEEVFLGKIVELRDKYMPLVTKCFQEVHQDLLEALREGIENICSEQADPGSSGREFIATICDNVIMRSGNEKWIDDSIDKTLEMAMELVSFMCDKYVFTEWYRKKLGRRLLHGGRFKEEIERTTLTKLNKVTCGLFTSEIEGMIGDFGMAGETQTTFVEYLGNNPSANPGIDLTVSVLTLRFWPSYKSSDFNLPEELVKCVEAFEAFHATQRRNRKLTWNHSLGYCHVEGKFEQKTIELIVSTHQAAALLLFNDADKLSCSEIMTKLNMSDEDVVKVVSSLSCSEYKILIKEPHTESISETDDFEFNYKFTDEKNQIEILLPPEDKKRKVAINQLDKDGSFVIDAAIVRIMKRKKVLEYQQLIDECVEALSHITLRPDIRRIKERVEKLIVHEYLERDSKNPDILYYCP